jgi:hypothetical protein
MGRLLNYVYLFVGGLALAAFFAPNAAADSMNITGFASGCFGSGCSAFESSANSILWGDLVVFTAGSFDVWTDTSGNASILSIGTISRGNKNIPDSGATDILRLQLSFTIPTGEFSGVYDATLEGTNHGGGGALNVDFSNTPLTFNFGSGSFQISLDDLNIQKNHTENITGSIHNAQFTEALGEQFDLSSFSGPCPFPDPSLFSDPNPVPEPTSLLLLGAGLGAIGLAAWRRMK